LKKNLFFILLVITGFLHAQSTANELETLLRTNAVTYAQAARFVLDAADVLNTSNTEEAFRYAVEQNWLPGGVSSGDFARLDGISLLIMHSFNLKGGIMYTIFKSPHYAYRELVYKNIVYGMIFPKMTVSGERLLIYINRLLDLNDELAGNI
jgi:hypothetical protein